MNFQQSAPRAANPWRNDPALRRWLEWRLPARLYERVAPGLDRLGERAVTDLAAAAADAEAHPPRLRRYDAWGRRVDEIETAAGWKALHAAAAEEGIVATAYERREDAWSRVHQFARLYLFHPVSALYSCPLAMSDGAARVLESRAPAGLRDRALPRLTSRDPARFWTSGQWMTERTGGSDVSGTETVARAGGGGFRLYGAKWFSSAATADMALTLARYDDRPGLGLFYLETRDSSGRLNGIRIERLKNKLGTRAMPTAELVLEGARAAPLGEAGAGVRDIAAMLNVTRLYNAVCAAASMSHGLALACDYARRRRAFGRELMALPLHRRTLARWRARADAALTLTFHMGALCGRDECGEASAAEQVLLRLLTPVTKLYTAKEAVGCASEVLECFGGAGYIEDTGLPRLLRDAQVLPIWEGTTNVLALDVQRVLARSDALEVLTTDIVRRMSALDHVSAAEFIAAAAVGLQAWPRAEALARDFSLVLARLYAASLLAEQADDGDERAASALEVYLEQPLRAQPPDRDVSAAVDSLLA